jgi:hypothetical protein
MRRRKESIWIKIGTIGKQKSGVILLEDLASKSLQAMVCYPIQSLVREKSEKTSALFKFNYSLYPSSPQNIQMQKHRPLPKEMR